MGYYLVLDNALTIERVVTAIVHHHHGAELLETGYFYVDLVPPEGNTRDENIT